MIGLGLALIPYQADQQLVRNLVALIEDSRFPFSFSLHRRTESMPHVSVMQGVFTDENQAIDALQEIDLSAIDNKLHVNDLTVWATKIVFLNFELSPWLRELHDRVFHAWQPISHCRSADPQSFTGISEGQRNSYKTTGYPFSLAEYLPHITLAHTQRPNTAESSFALLDRFRAASVPEFISFERLALFKVEPLGVLREMIYHWELSASTYQHESYYPE